MFDCFYNIVCIGFVFGVDYCGIFRDMMKSFIKVFVVVDKGDFEGVFIDVVLIVGRSENFGFLGINC